MKSKIVIIFISILLILSIGSVFASDDNNYDQLTEDSGIEPVEVADVEIQSQDTSISDESVEDLSSPSGVDVLEDGSVYAEGKVTNRYSDGVIYTATFYDDEGNPLKDSNIFCGVDSSELGYNLVTDSNGIVKIPLSIKNGNHKLYLYSAYNLDSPVVDDIKVFNVLSGNKNINMYYDNGNVYKVRVYGDDGKPVGAGQKVKFAIGSKTYTKITDKYGYAKLKITSKPGYYQIGALYKDYAVINTLYVKPVIKIATKFKGKATKSKIKLKVKFLGKNKKNKKITIKFNKKTYKAKTNKKGIAQFNLKTPKKVGKYTVVAKYKNTKVSADYVKYYM